MAAVNQLKIFHHLPDRDPKLVGVNDAGERLVFLQAARSLAEKIVSCETRTLAKFRRWLQ